MQEIQNIGLPDMAGVLALNNAHAYETSFLDASGISALLDHAFYCRGIDRGATAFLIALDQNAPYDNPNFNWFKRRYGSFVYIDRAIVAGAARGHGFATRLYEDLFTKVRNGRHSRVVCEINIDPPNLVSDAFHEAMGFTAVGRAIICSGKKEVRYFEKILT